MNKDDCFFSTDIHEWGMNYVGCKYMQTESYPPSCKGKCQCAEYISYQDARKIVMDKLKNRE